MATHPITGRTLAEGTTSPAGWTQDNSLEDWLADGGYLVWNFADSAARTAALTLSGKTLGATDRVICFLRTAGTIEVWDGSAWKALRKLSDIGANPATVEQSYGAVTGLNNTSLNQITTYSYTWTPSLSGTAYVTYSADVQQTTAGWVSFVLVPVRSGVALAGGKSTLYEGITRSQMEGDCAPFRVASGVAEPLTMNCAVFSSAGVVKVNGLTWTITVVPD